MAFRGTGFNNLFGEGRCTANKGFHVKELWQRGINDIRHKNVIPDLKIIFNPDGPIVKTFDI